MFENHFSLFTHRKPQHKRGALKSDNRKRWQRRCMCVHYGSMTIVSTSTHLIVCRVKILDMCSVGVLRFWHKVTHHALQQTNVLLYWCDWFISTLWLLSSEPENEESETQREPWLRFRTTSQIASLSTLSEGEVMFLSKYASGYLVKFGQKWWKGKSVSL